ncbi:O-antigen ligase family protein [uncultured Bacteroides sp.]|uniref:O-antigen ligase family protein n=1 Tax=uncultured Bacteroides sp. TaxID=162156 RepID=UPI003451CA46
MWTFGYFLSMFGLLLFLSSGSVCIFALFRLLFRSLYLHKKDSGNGRLLIWRVSCEMIKDAPLWGHGVDGFQKNYMLYQASFFNKYPTHKWRMLADDNSFAFNEYIKFVVEHGAVAAVFFFSFFLYVLLKQAGVSRLENIFSKSILLGWGIIAFFSYPFFLLQFIVLLLFFVAGIGGGNAMCMPCRETSICGICKFIGISWMIILFWGGILYGRKTILLFNRGTSLYAARRLDEAKDALKCSFLYTPDYNTAMLLGEIYSELQKCDSATYYWHLASEMVPNRIMPHFYLFRLYRGCDIRACLNFLQKVFYSASLEFLFGLFSSFYSSHSPLCSS